MNIKQVKNPVDWDFPDECPNCGSSNIEVFPWCPCHGGLLRTLGCHDERKLYNIFFDHEDETYVLAESLEPGKAKNLIEIITAT